MAPHAQTKDLIRPEIKNLRPAGNYSIDELFRLAQACHESGLFADTADAAQAFVKILKGQEMGLPPTAAMSAYDLIQKKLFIKPWAIAAKINACGYGTYRVEEQTNDQCTIVFSRKYPGKGWADCPAVTFTFAQAKAQGLTDRSVHWKSSPAHMLYQRCMGRGGAMYFPELLAGLEVPQDDTPLPPERLQENIEVLYGGNGGGSTPMRETPRSRYVASKMPTSDTSETQETSESGLQNSDALRGLKSEKRDSMAWETLEAHKDDAQLPEDLLDRINAALSPLAPATESEAFTLANELLAYLDHAQMGRGA